MQESNSLSETIPYDPKRFDVHSISEAMAIILTPEDSTTQQRWATETPYLSDLIAHHFDLQTRHRVLDFGCGIGRISKNLIKKTGCSVVGVDTSVSMRSLAPAYVLDKRFLSCAPEMLPLIAKVNFAISVWTLQHIPDLSGAIDLVKQQLLPYGKLLVVNSCGRCLPVPNGLWVDDKQDTRELLCARFNEVAFGALDPEKTTPKTSVAAFWGVYERRS